MDDKKKSIREVIGDAKVDKIKSEADQVEEVIGELGKEVIASHSGKKYHFRPVSLKQIPNLFKLITTIQTKLKASPEDAEDVQQPVMCKSRDREIGHVRRFGHAAFPVTAGRNAKIGGRTRRGQKRPGRAGKGVRQQLRNLRSLG